MSELFTAMPPAHWCVTPYRLCDYRCVYCCTGAQGESTPLMSAADAAAETRRRLREIPKPRYMILGALSDAYPSVESRYGITRAIVAELVRDGQRFAIVTKGDIVLRDLDLLRAAQDRVLVQISICTTDDAALRKLDPGAPSGSERFAAIRELHGAGIRTGLNILPWIPDVTDTDALIARVPVGVEITLGALTFGKEKKARSMLGRVFTRDEVVRRYLEEYRRVGHHPATSWVRPPPPGEDNSARNRLPRLVYPVAEHRVGAALGS